MSFGRGRHTWCLSAFLGSLALAGCGLSEYEKRMDDQKAALAIFDEENKALGDPLDVPMKSTKDKAGNPMVLPALPAEFFLRPLKGIARKSKDGPFGEQAPLYRYPGRPGFNILIGVGFIRNPKDKRPSPGALSPEEFQLQTLGAVADFYQKENKKVFPQSWLTAIKPGKKVEAVSVTDKPANVKEPKDAAKFSVFRLYFREKGVIQGAVVFQFPADKEKDTAFNQALDWSSKSFGLGPDVVVKRQEYRRRHGG